jgi:hypothetical protein
LAHHLRDHIGVEGDAAHQHGLRALAEMRIVKVAYALPLELVRRVGSAISAPVTISLISYVALLQ